MAQIDIKVNNVRSSNSRLKGITSDLTDTQSRISSLRHAIDSQITSRQGIGVNLSSMASSIHEIEKRLNQLHNFVDNSVAQYEQADKQVNSQSQKLTDPPKKSFWDSVGDILGVAGRSIKGFATGLWDAVVSTVEGIWHVITHPIETIKGLVHVIQHPVETGKAIWDAIKTSWNEDVVNGDAESRGNWFGRAFGEVALAIVGTKGIDKAIKLSRGANVVDEVGGVRIVDNSGSNNKPDAIDPTDVGFTIEPRIVDEILQTNKGNRPDPSTYLPQEYIVNHLAKFDDGVTKIAWAAPTRPLGPPGGTFVMPKSVADELISQSNGNVTKLEELLSLEPGTLGETPVRIDISHPTGLRMPDGNELGANEQWIPGGYTGGGIPEATIDQVPLDKLVVNDLFLD
jgi:hypothetical protein